MPMLSTSEPFIADPPSRGNSLRSNASKPKGSVAVSQKAFFNTWTRLLGTVFGQLLLLVCCGVSFVFGGTFLWHLTGGNLDYSDNFHDSFWISYLLFADVGTQTSFDVTEDKSVRIVAVFLSVIGFTYWLCFLGLVVDLIRELLQGVKDVYSRVTASDHILILGWNDKILFLLSEIFTADRKFGQTHRGRFRNCCRRRGLQVVILSKCPVMEMRQEVAMFFSNSDEHTVSDCRTISYRTGDPTSRTELIKVSVHSARDILIMAETRQASDQKVLQALLALGALPGGLASIAGEVHAEITNFESERVAMTIMSKARPVVARSAALRMLVLRALVKNLGYVYLQMATSKIGTCDLYVRPVPTKLIGVPFEEAILCFPSAVVLGVQDAALVRLRATGRLLPLDGRRPLQDGDCLLVYAATVTEGDHVVRLPSANFKYRSVTAVAPSLSADADDGAKASAEPVALQNRELRASLVAEDGQVLLSSELIKPKVVVLIGCPQDYPSIISILNDYCAAGSRVHILSQKSVEYREEVMRRYIKNICPIDGSEADATNCDFSRVASGRKSVTSPQKWNPFRRLEVVHHVGVCTVKGELADLPLSTADCVVVLAEQKTDSEAPIAADTRNLTTVITLKEISKKLRQGKKKMKIVTEVHDSESALVIATNDSVRSTGSFVHTCQQEAGMLAMSVLHPESLELMKSILDPASKTGHITAVQVKTIVRGCEKLSFYDLHERVWRACHGVLMGWRRNSDRYAELNPKDKVVSLEWNDNGGDELIVFRSYIDNSEQHFGVPASGTPDSGAFRAAPIQTDLADDAEKSVEAISFAATPSASLLQEVPPDGERSLPTDPAERAALDGDEPQADEAFDPPGAVGT